MPVTLGKTTIGATQDTVVLQKNRTPTLGRYALLQVCPAAGQSVMGVVPRNGVLSEHFYKDCMKIALFIHQPACSVDSANGIITALSSQYSFKLFSKDQVEDTFFDDVDCVCVPGGIGDADRFDTLMKYNYDTVRDYVNQGGKYLGICMGAYWAGKDYFDLLDDVKVEQYIKRPNTDTHRPHPKAMPVMWNNEQHRMYFYDGCAFEGNNFKTVATYPNTDPMAIIQHRIGLIGCHPESNKYWYNKKYLEPHWHQGIHYNLLLDFVNSLA